MSAALTGSGVVSGASIRITSAGFAVAGRARMPELFVPDGLEDAVRFLAGQPRGLFDMVDVLNLR